ncbi:hypothetical protein VULLAG_LOCUS13197 [Vulpes lagopus]
MLVYSSYSVTLDREGREDLNRLMAVQKKTKYVAEVGIWERSNLDNMKVMLVSKERRLDSLGRAIPDPSIF